MLKLYHDGEPPPPEPLDPLAVFVWTVLGFLAVVWAIQFVRIVT